MCVGHGDCISIVKFGTEYPSRDRQGAENFVEALDRRVTY